LNTWEGTAVIPQRA